MHFARTARLDGVRGRALGKKPDDTVAAPVLEAGISWGRLRVAYRRRGKASKRVITQRSLPAAEATAGEPRAPRRVGLGSTT